MGPGAAGCTEPPGGGAGTALVEPSPSGREPRFVLRDRTLVTVRLSECMG